MLSARAHSRTAAQALLTASAPAEVGDRASYSATFRVSREMGTDLFLIQGRDLGRTGWPLNTGKINLSPFLYANRSTVSATHLTAPNGRPRCTLCRTAASVSSASGAFTHATQLDGSATGPSLRKSSPCPLPRCRHHRLPQRQSSARATSLARRAFRSTYRHTVSRCSSVCTGKDLNRP